MSPNAPISVNVYGIDAKNEKVFPLHISQQLADETEIDLLFIKIEMTSTAATKSATKITHYCLIRNFSRLLRSEVTRNPYQYHFCKICLSHFNTEEKLSEHKTLCREHEPTRVIMPLIL